jgi:hypothetical protein
MGQRNIFFRERLFWMRSKDFFERKRFLSANTGALLEAFCFQVARQIRSFSILVLKPHSEKGSLTIRERSCRTKNFGGAKINGARTKIQRKHLGSPKKDRPICIWFVKYHFAARYFFR